MSPMQKLGYKHTRAEWYAQGEAYDLAMETGNMNPAVNPSYVDATYKENLKSLARKYPEPPLVIDKPQIENKKIEEPVNESKLISELQQDNAKYINTATNYVNNMSDEVFLNHLKNIDELVKKVEPFIFLIPIQVQGMINNTSTADLKELFKTKCSKKFEIIEKEGLTSKLLEMFESLKLKIKQ
jgi:hypothetical protein